MASESRYRKVARRRSRMRVTGRGLLTVIRPLEEKRAREIRQRDSQKTT